MEKTIITFSANEQCLQKTSGIYCYASNIVSYIEAHFDLGANWSGYDSVRAVWSNDNNMTVISTALDSNGVCVVPFEVLKTKGVVKVNLVGSISVSDVLTDRLTTFPCEAVKVTAKAKIEGSETQPITPSQYEQFVANVKADADRAETVRDEAEAARDVAVSAKDTAVNAVEGFEDIVDTATATAVQTIQGEGATQVTAIQTEGTTQVASVRTEGSTQVTAVQDKGDEVLDSIPADYTQLSQNVTDLKSDLEAYSIKYVYDFAGIPIQKGVLYDTTANKETNTIITISDANNRVVLGPLKFSKSVEISCDNAIKYKIYKRYSTDTSNSFRDMSSTWRTVKQIEGSNDESYPICNYYIQMAYANDSMIADAKDVLKYLHINYTNDNPLGLIETGGVLSNTGIPNGVGGGSTVLRMLSYKQKYGNNAFFGIKNPDMQVAPIYGEDIYTSATNGTFRYGGFIMESRYENAVMIQDYTNGTATNIEFKNYQSFADLYDDLGIHVEEMIADNKRIEGNQTTDAHQIVNASTYGDTILNSIVSNGIVLNDGGSIKYSHVPSIEVYDGFAYVAFQCDRTATQEFAPTTEIELAKIDLESNEVTYTTIAKSGTYHGVTYDGRASNPCVRLIGDAIYILFTASVNGSQTLCCAILDTSTDTIEASVCNFTFNGSSYVFNVTNFDRYIGGYYGIPSLDYEIIVCAPTGENGTYYTTLASGSNGQKKVPILQTTDLVNFVIYDVLPYKYGADCECVSYLKDGVLHIASRHPYTDCTTKLMLYNVSTKKITEELQISSTASRPTIFKNESTLVISIPMTGRRAMQFMQFLDARIGDGRLLASIYSWMGLSYSAIIQNDDRLYYAIQTRYNNGSLSETPHILFGSSGVLVG